MKITSIAKLNVVAKAEPTHSADGRFTYYKVTFVQDTEAGKLSCTEDVYNNVIIGTPSDYLVEYSDSATSKGSYKSFKVVGIVTKSPAPSK
jgi:hypothetical protein